jgi:hypothetical protein
MTFSKEDQAAWENSEVMRELEKLADDVLNPSPEAYQPISIDEKSWEEEDWVDEKKLTDAASELLGNENSFEEELKSAYNNRLCLQLEKIAEWLEDKNNIKAAYKVERSIQKIKALLQEEK